ncbi:ABC transporter ATP-binding protein [Candidatus Bathyarchaeota archaeon]|nr:MAG: ABC transporter ATP-binding protein [Candidatus Bathyarchaeota archaeon]
MKDSLVEVKNLVVRFYTYAGIVEALEGVNLHIRPGEILGLVGETGCGKSVTSFSILQLVPPPGKIEGGEIYFNKDGKVLNIRKLDEDSIRKIRGKEIAMVFQEPRAYLNPVYTIETQIGEALLTHRREEFLKRAIETLEKTGKGSSFERKVYERMLKKPKSIMTRIMAKFCSKKTLKEEIRKEVIDLLRNVEIADPERVAKMYPFELSGGMAQRAVIAMALSCNPMMLIADEPTTNLDVTVQAQILKLIRQLRERFKSSILYITHDLGVIAELCDRVAVMYAGRVVELADVYELFKDPLHPYTKALLESIPRPGQEFKSIPGTVPNLINPPKGCRFHERCQYEMEICRKVKPEFIEVKKDHFVACHLYGGLK